jgi:hypothetical protein
LVLANISYSPVLSSAVLGCCGGFLLDSPIVEQEAVVPLLPVLRLFSNLTDPVFDSFEIMDPLFFAEMPLFY